MPSRCPRIRIQCVLACFFFQTLFADPCAEAMNIELQNFNFWHALDIEVPWQEHHYVNQAWVSDILRVVYIENQKAASRTIISILTNLDHKLRLVWLPYRAINKTTWQKDNKTKWPVQLRELNAFWPSPQERSPWPANYTVFTFVRDPIAKFVSGVAELVERTYWNPEIWLGTSNRSRWPNYAKHNCTASNIDQIFSDFVLDVQAGRGVSVSAFHVWPQSLQVDVLPQNEFNFIGRVEHLDEDMSALLSRAGFNRSIKIPRLNTKPVAGDFCYRKASTHTVRRLLPNLCDIVKVDTVCFSRYFDMPRCIQKTHKSLLIREWPQLSGLAQFCGLALLCGLAVRKKRADLGNRLRRLI